MLGTVTLKSWFSCRSRYTLSDKNINFRTPHITSLVLKLIDVLSHSGHEELLYKTQWYLLHEIQSADTNI